MSAERERRERVDEVDERNVSNGGWLCNVSNGGSLRNITREPRRGCGFVTFETFLRFW